MPPRRRPTSGYHGVRAQPSGRFDAEICSGEERIRLGTFDTMHEAARAYDAVAWRLGRSRRTMNFHDVWTREQAEQLATPPVITHEQQRRRRELEHRLLIAERDGAPRLEWARQFPEDVAATEAFYAHKEEKAAAKAKNKASRDKRRAESATRKAVRAEKAARKEEEKKNGAGPSTIVLSSSSFEWTSTSVSETTPSSHSSNYESTAPRQMFVDKYDITLDNKTAGKEDNRPLDQNN
nr:ethylene-responsive transcription factor ERF113-like [Lolium perenne]